MSSEPQITSHERQAMSDECFGSALILTVVLTSLLAIVGVLFVMVARVDKIATTAISENKELDFAVETLIAKISQELVSDVISPAAEYYDYPGPEDKWLAHLEPYTSGSNYYWRQISDVTGALAGQNKDIQAVIISEYDTITNSNNPVANADADGDGVGDSKWIQLNDITTNKGKPIYAAVRIIDNGSMLNVNTGYKFEPGDPNSNVFDVQGTSQMQINLMALAGRAGNPPTSDEEIDLLAARANNGIGVDPLDLRRYQENVIWRFSEPNDPYTPFDISDELELRNRFLLNHTDIDTRLENWSFEFRNDTLSTPVTSGGEQLDYWFKRACDDGSLDPNYAYRHIATTYNVDRTILPAGTELNNGKMISVNIADKNLLYAAIKKALYDADPNEVNINADMLAAQLAVNIIDHRDHDTAITVLPSESNIHYGFEDQPFISEIAFKISETDADISTNNHFAIELYNPFNVDILLSDFRLELHRQTGELVSTINLTGYGIPRGGRFVITNGSSASSNFGITQLISSGGGKEDSNLELAKYIRVSTDSPTYQLSERYDIYLLRQVEATDIYLDQQKTEDTWFDWDIVKENSQFYCRPDNNWNVIYQNLQPAANTLGTQNGITASQRNYNIETSVGPFITAGEIARVLTVGCSTDPCDMLGMRLADEPGEELIRLDLQNPAFTNIFNYLTVIDPTNHGLDEYETRIKGRINVNTAPWFVIAQLPWIQYADSRPFEKAQAICNYRDKFGTYVNRLGSSGFVSSADLMQVPQMQMLGADGLDNLYSDVPRGPDLTQDTARDDFEERDLIFSRISNLVTVRSDVFTAYILVRIGVDGPQKRVVAILDRSQAYSSSGKVRIVALHPVSDPR